MDSVYIDRILNGSTDDFRFLIKKYKDLAFSVALAVVKNEFEAEEVVQEAFILSYRNLSKLKNRGNFKPWFYRILIHEAFKRFHRIKAEIVLPTLESLPDWEETEDTFRGLSGDEQVQVVNESLKQLPAKESLALQLFYLEGCTIGEMTNLTGWSESNVKVILHRARKHLLEAVNVMMKNELILDKLGIRKKMKYSLGN